MIVLKIDDLHAEVDRKPILDGLTLGVGAAEVQKLLGIGLALMTLAGVVADRFGLRTGAEPLYPDVPMVPCPPDHPKAAKGCPDPLKPDEANAAN